MQILHSFSYSRYVKILKNLTFNRKIELIKINPVYSTKIIVQIWFLVYTYILYVFLMQIIWIAVLFSIANFAFKIGVNKYESQGG